MKKCPQCNRTYADESFSFCLEDGALLSASYDPDTTLVIPEAINSESLSTRTNSLATVMLHEQNRSMTEAEQILVCFVRGLNVFGRNKLSMDDLRAQCDSAFERSNHQIRFLTYYRPTGNFAVLAPGIASATVRDILVQALGKPCAVANLTTLDRIKSTFDSWPEPNREERERWTPGFALRCDGVALPRRIEACETGVFNVLDESTVVVYRRERETPASTLDRNYRRGGWGAVTARIEATLGGTWTARSLSVAAALSRKCSFL